MNVLIIESKEADIDSLSKSLCKFGEENGLDFNITVISKFRSLDLLSIEKFDIIFLGMRLEGDYDGLEIGKKIRGVNKQVKLIIMTKYKQYLIEGYKIKPERYFLKPLDQKVFEFEKKEVINVLEKEKAYIFDSTISNEKIYINEIVYIEFYLRKCIIHFLNKDSIVTRTSLKYLFYLVKDNNFLYAHKSFVINLAFVKGISANEVIMKDNSFLPLSRNYKKWFKEEYDLYLKRKN